MTDPFAYVMDGLPEGGREMIVLPPDLSDLNLFALEELSYSLAQQAGESETMMWVVLAEIRQTGKWKRPEEPDFGWEAYAKEWLHETCSRTGRQMPWSLREMQTRLSNHRRLCEAYGADPQMILGGSSDAMAKLTRALGTWDVDSGVILELAPFAKQGLQTLFPDQPLEQQIKQAAEAVAAIPVHKDAIAFINDNFGPPVSQQIGYQFFIDSPHGAPVVMAKITRYDTDTGEALEERTYGPQDAWPAEAIEELARRVK